MSGENPNVDGVPADGQDQNAPDPGLDPNLDAPQPDEDLQMLLKATGIEGGIEGVNAVVDERDYYKSNFGRSQNEVGELRRKIAEMEARLNQQPQNHQPQNNPYGYYDEPESQQYNQSPPVSLKDVEGAVEKVVQRYVEGQNRASEYINAKWAAIKSQPDYQVVGPLYEEMIQKPEIQQRMRQTNQFGEPLETMDSLYSKVRGLVLAKKVDELQAQIPKQNKPQNQNIQPGTPPGQQPDASDRTPAPLTDIDKRKQQVVEGKKNLDPMAVLDAIIPNGDPILR